MKRKVGGGEGKREDERRRGEGEGIKRLEEGEVPCSLLSSSSNLTTIHVFIESKSPLNRTRR